MIRLFRVEEAKLDAWLKRSKAMVKPVVNPNFMKPQFSPMNKPTPTPTSENLRTLPVRGLTREQLNENRRKGLCFSCDEPYGRDHVCKKPHLFMLLPSEQEGIEDGECDEELGKEEYHQECEEIEPQITLHALSGHITNNTIRLLGKSNGRNLRILVDSGSTNNFMDPQAAKKVRASLTATQSISVTVADGFKVTSHQLCSKLDWTIQDKQFQTEFRILPLGGIDAVLGVQWLKNFESVTFDFHRMQLSLMKAGQTIRLQGESDRVVPTIQLMDSGDFRKNLNSATHGYFGYLFDMFQGGGEDNKVQNRSVPVDPSQEGQKLEELLQHYSEVFQEPKDLPPTRSKDHHIVLKEGSQPVSLRPYRYPHVQKEEIEKIVKEMLKNGIIQPSNSPYAFPVLLVKKHDGTWRMCVDYRALNNMTIKDKFPIPAIDELLDELHGSNWFSKLDLRSGYHQIRVCKEDIPKTAFRTHSGHFEFLVLPFGLTNAPATFQSLMNEVFHPYLRKFVLVFFDDILVYSKTYSEQLQHLQLVLQLLQTHCLFAKKSKCVFGVNQIQYLGHVINQEGVATDPEKVSCMIQWPLPFNLKGLKGFLGLTGYYKRFIRNYGLISKPLTDLLKKDNFKWDDKATMAFQNLKTTMTQAPVLAMPDFKNPFVLETDASYYGI